MAVEVEFPAYLKVALEMIQCQPLHSHDSHDRLRRRLYVTNKILAVFSKSIHKIHIHEQYKGCVRTVSAA